MNTIIDHTVYRPSAQNAAKTMQAMHKDKAKFYGTNFVSDTISYKKVTGGILVESTV